MDAELMHVARGLVLHIKSRLLQSQLTQIHLVIWTAPTLTAAGAYIANRVIFHRSIVQASYS